jgi:transglutaminase-like putative cysteine protease
MLLVSKFARQRLLLISLMFLVARPGLASLFGKQPPIPQWALEANQTKTPDYAKDAVAVILFDEHVETVNGDGRALERRRKVVRILKPQGRDQYCGVAYDVDEKINFFHAWTIAADGKQYPAQDTDFADQGDTSTPTMLSMAKFRVAEPPARDVGAAVVCESEELLRPYLQEKVWDFQLGIPVVSEALEVDLPGGRSYSEAWHRYKAVKPVEVASGHWRWEMHDVPALNLRDIPSHPDWDALAGRMSVQWGDAAVAGKDNQWKAIGIWVTKLEANRPDPSPEITAKVQALIAGAPDFYTKLARITESIQKDIRYFVVMRGVGGFQANYASDIFRNRYGDCKDKTTLLISMLQVAGIHAFYVPVDSRRDVVDPEEPSLVVGNHMITAVEIPADVQDPRLKAIVKATDGKRYLIFDPTNERTPVGNLPSYEQGGYGLLAAGSASQVIALPVLSPDSNGTDRKGAFTLSADGTLSGSVDQSHSGPEGGDLRLFLKETDDKQRRESWEKYVAEDVPGVVVNSFQFVEPKSLNEPIEFHYKFTAGKYAHTAGPLLLVRPRVVGSDVLANNDKPRTVPIDLNATGHWHDSYDIEIPEGYVVDDMPDPVNVETDFATYHSSVSTPEAGKGKVLHYERDLKVSQVELPAERAPDFRHLEGLILSDEKSTVVLKKAVAGQPSVGSSNKQ